jgi:hypothetical protein
MMLSQFASLSFVWLINEQKMWRRKAPLQQLQFVPHCVAAKTECVARMLQMVLLFVTKAFPNSVKSGFCGSKLTYLLAKC